VELRGFEPLTSAVQASARLTGSSLPFLGGSLATSAHGQMWSLCAARTLTAAKLAKNCLRCLN
jgi:hypothetical protein